MHDAKMINFLSPAICLRPLFAATVALSPAIAHAHPDPDAFAGTAFTQEPALVDCTLENGAAVQCYELTVGYRPEGQEIGPFCPATVDDKAGCGTGMARRRGSTGSTAPSSPCWKTSDTAYLTRTAW